MIRIVKAAVAAVGLLCAVAPASAAVSTFDFSGTCASWICTGGATATLTLTDYTLGADLDVSNFVSLTYSADSGATFTMDATGIDGVWGRLGGPTFVPGIYSVEFWGTGTDKASHDLYTYFGDGGGWNADNREQGVGLSFRWTGDGLDTGSVPEPASWAMMLGGFGLVGGAMRHRRAKVRFA
jgi:hypothetical protein